MFQSSFFLSDKAGCTSDLVDPHCLMAMVVVVAIGI